MSGLTYHYRHYDFDGEGEDFGLRLPMLARNAYLTLLSGQSKDSMDALGLSDAEQDALLRIAISMQ